MLWQILLAILVAVIFFKEFVEICVELDLPSQSLS